MKGGRLGQAKCTTALRGWLVGWLAGGMFGWVFGWLVVKSLEVTVAKERPKTCRRRSKVSRCVCPTPWWGGGWCFVGWLAGGCVVGWLVG